MTFGKTLTSLRQRAGNISKEELSNAVGIKKWTIDKWENGSRQISNVAWLEGLITFFAQKGVLTLPQAQDWIALTKFKEQFDRQKLDNIFGLTASYHYPTASDGLSKQAYCRATDITMFGLAMQEAGKQGKHTQMVELAIELAKAHQADSQLQQARRVYEEILPEAKKLTDGGYLAARIKSNLAYVYSEVDEAEWEAGIAYCQAAIQTFKRLQRRDDLVDPLPHAYNNLGLLAMRSNQASDAIKSLSTARKLWEKAGNSTWWVNAGINLGVCRLQVGNGDRYQQARQEFRKLLDVTTHDSMTTARILLNQSVAWRAEGEWEAASDCLERAKTIFQAHDYQSGLVKVDHNLASTSLGWAIKETPYQRDKLAEARYYFELAHQGWQKLNNRYRLEQTEAKIAECEQAMSRYVLHLTETPIPKFSRL